MDEDKIKQRRRDQEEQSTQARAAILGVKYIDTRPIEQDLELITGALDNQSMRQNRMVPLMVDYENQLWRFGITTQTPQSLVMNMTREYNDSGRNIEFCLISQAGFQVLMNRYDPPREIIYDDIRIASEGDSATLARVSSTLNSVSSDRVFDYLIDQADKLNASDIHIENQRTYIRIRMRIDGALHPVADLDKDRYRVILGALASRADISTASASPQSGHIQKEVDHDGDKHMLNLRVEVIPTMYGLDAVLRLFNFDASMLNLDSLGISQPEKDNINEIVSHPHGMALLVGPTGSGKSTTLYSMLNALNTPDRKIITLEDPIEYGIDGISQIPIDTSEGQSFADALRSVLRLDPDVVMIGEIRDKDTARTAIQASITGHLVLSSFHANSSAAAFSRMIDLIGANPIFSSSIRLVIAQRLLRRLDDSSKQEYEPDEATRRWVAEALKDLPPDVEKPDFDNFKLWRPVTSEVSPFGYSGRMAIMEQMVVDEEIQKFIRGDILDIQVESIEKAARSGGMVTLLEKGVLAALRGETTLEEVNRVI